MTTWNSRFKLNCFKIYSLLKLIKNNFYQNRMEFTMIFPKIGIFFKISWYFVCFNKGCHILHLRVQEFTNSFFCTLLPVFLNTCTPKMFSADIFEKILFVIKLDLKRIFSTSFWSPRFKNAIINFFLRQLT